MENPRARIEYRTDTETKQRLTEFSEQNSRKVSDVINEAVHQYLDSQQPDEASEGSVRGLEKQLRRCEDEYAKRSNEKDVAGMNGDEAYYFAAFLVDEPYKALSEDWQKIRFQALQDFHSDPPPGWVREWSIKSELQIIEVCRLAADLKELKAKREELTQKLNSLYRNLGENVQVKENVASERPKLETPGSPATPG